MSNERPKTKKDRDAARDARVNIAAGKWEQEVVKHGGAVQKLHNSK